MGSVKERRIKVTPSFLATSRKMRFSWTKLVFMEEAIGHAVWSFVKEIWTECIVLRVLRTHMAFRA